MDIGFIEWLKTSIKPDKFWVGIKKHVVYDFKSQLLWQNNPNNEIKIPMIDESIFREYDIRGVVPSQINEASIDSISNAIAKNARMRILLK